APQAAAPQAAAPQAAAPQAAAPKVAAPQVAAPQVAAPQVAAPQVAAPQVAAPQVAAELTNNAESDSAQACGTVPTDFQTLLDQAMDVGMSDQEIVKTILHMKNNDCICEIFTTAMEKGLSLKQLVSGALDAGLASPTVAKYAVSSACCEAPPALVAAALGVKQLPGLGYTPANEAPPVSLIQGNPGGRATAGSVSPSAPQ
uniref:hypothetical protein n=1 Tax=uncultured Desulfuromonas sp. TaxID=181013 RepID=UPI0026124CB3